MTKNIRMAQKRQDYSQKQEQQKQINISSQKDYSKFESYQFHWGNNCQLTYDQESLDYVQKIQKVEQNKQKAAEKQNNMISDCWSRLNRNYTKSQKISIHQDQKILYFMYFWESGGGQSYKTLQYLWCSPSKQDLINQAVQFFVGMSEESVSQKQRKRVQRELRISNQAALQGLYCQPTSIFIQQAPLDRIVKQEQPRQTSQIKELQQKNIEGKDKINNDAQSEEVEHKNKKRRKLNTE